MLETFIQPAQEISTRYRNSVFGLEFPRLNDHVTFYIVRLWRNENIKANID